MRALALIAGLSLVSSAMPAPAACVDDVAAQETRLSAEAHQAPANQSGGQATAAARDGKAEEARKTGKPVEDLAKPPSADNEKATQAAASPTGGEAIMQAKVALNEAHNAAEKGDEAGCRAALDKAKAHGPN